MLKTITDSSALILYNSKHYSIQESIKLTYLKKLISTINKIIICTANKISLIMVLANLKELKA